MKRKIRMLDPEGIYMWKTVDVIVEKPKPKVVEPLKVGVIETKRIKPKPQPKPKKNPYMEGYKNKLLKIAGIGIKTCKDIISMYPTISKLKAALMLKKDIPIRDDLSKLLKRKFK